MKSTLARRRTIVAAASAAALLALACGTKGPGNANPTPEAIPTELTLTAGTLLFSNGTNTVTIGGRQVTFPGPVTDATWSPDGTRIAYVDGDGNIATARPDGSDVLVLTKKDAGVVRSRPSWSRQWIFYSEKKGTKSTLMSVETNGCSIMSQPTGGQPYDLFLEPNGDIVGDVAPSAALAKSPGRIAFEHILSGGPQIWVNDSNQREPRSYRAVNGTEPALTADGKKLAYVGEDGQIYVTTISSNTPAGTKITSGTETRTHLTWSPDGARIAYETATGVQEVPAGGGAPTSLAATPAVPSYLAAVSNSVNRINGTDAIGLSIAASQARWPTMPGYQPSQGYRGALTAVLATPANALKFAADMQGGPLLITDGKTLDPRTKAELQRIFGTVNSDTTGTPSVLLLGSDISASVESAVQNLGLMPEREDVNQPPAAASGVCGPQGDEVSLFQQVAIVVDAASTVDNAIATALAASWNAPIVRLSGGSPSADQVAYLGRTAPSLEAVYVVDSTGAVSADVTTQLADLISGPGGHTAATNPTAPAIS
jgi:hypothetical protein